MSSDVRKKSLTGSLLTSSDVLFLNPALVSIRNCTMELRIFTCTTSFGVSILSNESSPHLPISLAWSPCLSFDWHAYGRVVIRPCCTPTTPAQARTLDAVPLLQCLLSGTGLSCENSPPRLKLGEGSAVFSKAVSDLGTPLSLEPRRPFPSFSWDRERRAGVIDDSRPDFLGASRKEEG